MSFGETGHRNGSAVEPRRGRHRYGMTKRKVAALFSEQFGLPLSIGGLVQMQHRMADGFTPEYEA